MTKYVVNSGGVRNEPQKAKEFFAEVVKGLGAEPKILLCFFAQPREEWEERFADDTNHRVADFMPEGLNPVYSMAFPETFVEQMLEADAIYIHGGDDHLVQYWLKQLDVPRVWDGKVVATNSASTHALSESFWTCDWRMCKDGMGILPIKTLAHFKSDYGMNDPRGPIDWDAAKKELEAYGDISLPVYALPEGEFIVLEQ